MRTKEKHMEKGMKERFDELYVKKANLIEHVMKLRHEQAVVKAEIVKLATQVGDRSLISSQPDCW
jgi:hypothetical protein